MAVLSFFVFACGEPSEEEVSPSDPVSIVRSWTEVTSAAGFTGRYYHTSAVFNSALWVIGGFDGSNRLNDVWKSTDGVTWTQVTSAAGFSGRRFHTSAVFRGKNDTQDALWVIGGLDGSFRNDVWKYQ